MTPNGIAMRAIRESKNVSLRELARRTGLDRGYLSRVERGLVRRPDDAKVIRIAEALQVPPAAIDREETT